MLMEALQLLKFQLKKERLDFMDGWSTSDEAMRGYPQPIHNLGSLLVDDPENVVDNVLMLFDSDADD